MFTPDAFPDKTLATSPSVLCSISSPETSLTAYPRAFLSLVIPCAVTTTSSNCATSSPRVTLIVLDEPTVLDSVVYPT